MRLPYLPLPLLPFTGILILILSSFSPGKSQSPGWKHLFNGNDLDGWVKQNGEAKYIVRNKEIVGITQHNTPNTFLCTEKAYDNFILEFEVLADTSINSGVQFRSNIDPDYRNGIVHGYQAEIDPSPRAWSGGIYDEGRRGWLYPLTDNPQGRAAYRPGVWNTYRIEAIGSTMRIWVNGIQTANLVDDLTASGFIGLQVHSIPDNPELKGREIRWRNLRIKTTDLQNERWQVAPYAPEIDLTK